MVWYDEKYPHFFGLPMEIRDMSSCSVESEFDFLAFLTLRYLVVVKISSNFAAIC